MTSFADKLPLEAICSWPNGQERTVMVTEDDGMVARILWNEQVDSKYKAVTGFHETVPSKWLEYS